MNKMFLATMFLSLITKTAFATQPREAIPCQNVAQQAIYALAQVNGIITSADIEKGKLIVELAHPEQEVGQVTKWKSADERFKVETNNRQFCFAEKVLFIPEVP